MVDRLMCPQCLEAGREDEEDGDLCGDCGTPLTADDGELCSDCEAELMKGEEETASALVSLSQSPAKKARRKGPETDDDDDDA